MEDKPPAGATESPASAEPSSSSRRRAGGQKRKANALSSSSNSSSTPSKRLTREKAAISQISIHNSGGPLTRARQSPSNFGALPGGGSAGGGGIKVEEKVAVALTATEVAAALLEEEEASKIEELKGGIESEFEVIRSRDSNAHVVPSHCGWFSWTKVHPLEERILPSFFNGKSQIRTPDTYMEIRNWIVRKFHSNPNVQIELKDLSELEVADMDSKQEVLEFLDYWGLINFHPFPLTDSSPSADSDGVSVKDSLLEKLFRFKTIQPCRPVVPKPNNVTTPALPSGLFPESSVAEELVRPEGPSVEYHCNSCSADCSRKRYHCQTQADYDLCADCFNNGKFGSDMASSDFILMEPAEAPGVSGGKWTDQETLLLLEALELFKENWNEIAEHVATKTKAQCILHFVQMPIEDVFFDCDDDVDENSKEITDPLAAIDETSAPKDGIEASEDKIDGKEDQPQTSLMEGANETKDGQETAKPDNASEAIVGEGTSNTKDTSGVKDAPLIVEDVALKALTEAFESVGYLSTPENRLSFAEVGNPVMALAAFLGRLAGREIAIASAQSSLKSLSTDSPSLQLAARHCFLLEDPPDDQKGSAGIDSAIEMANQDAPKNNQEDQSQRGNETTLNDPSNKNIEDSTAEEKQPPGSSNKESCEKVNTANDAVKVSHEEVEPGKLKESNELELEKEPKSSILKNSNKMSSKSECPTSPVKETEASLVTPQSQHPENSKDVDMVSDLKPSGKNEPSQPVASLSVEESPQAAKGPKDEDMVLDSLPPENKEPQQKVKSNSLGDHSLPTEAPMDVDMMSSLPSETKEPQQPVAPNSMAENGATTAKVQKDNNTEKPDCKRIKDDHGVDKIKRAAVSTLSAAAVKAKLLAGQEEDLIRQLAASLVEKQLHKLEMKLAFFNEMDHIILRVREQLDRSRQRLYHERAQIIATRLGIPPSTSRPMPPTLPANRIAMNIANSNSRPPMNINTLRPPISRPMGALGPTPSNPFVSTTAGNSIRPSSQDNPYSVVTK
ncbi:SWI/SNF complex subunit SWI3D isoform X2 [Mercurialis annua]|uniref:SWI/SNF complex subunit SWI3D isoform X2 n=1 Tax=Mercurialis annua TaxID=3986 RepID=UPI002160BBE0|nr:SWI/SNF complex subunit SWI3D isoform X2 [Mercurialis annua]